ncbi:MAG: glycosyltransferase involved in cell wall biosynthesis [Planctomycetota bacterium]|jgi:glycosyltransferase involved in cell wall biosynthesis
MQILFVHPNFPAQFGPFARRMALRSDLDVVFVSRNKEGQHDGLRCLRFEPRSGATKATHYCSRTFENSVWNAHAVFETCQRTPDLKPDVIVGHSGFGTTAFLGELFDAPIVNLFEYWYRGRGSDMDFRPEFPPRDLDFLRSKSRNAMILMDLQECAAGYVPTAWQRSLFPAEWQPKLEQIHDGIDTEFWKRRPRSAQVAGVNLPAEAPVITFVARGLEAMRGFDIFMQVAQRIARARPEAHFLVVGGDRTHYGNDLRHIKHESFREHVMAEQAPQIPNMHFLGMVDKNTLVDVFSASDLHIYLTVPFVLSWSLLNAMSCETVVLGSRTAPVQEVVTEGETGFLADFSDVGALTEKALAVLDEPNAHRDLGRRARLQTIERYSVEHNYPKFCSLLSRVTGRDSL